MEITYCKQKLEKIQQQMGLSGADACLLCVDVNLYYLTKQIYNGYFYIPAEGKPYFFVKRPAGFSGENVFYIRKPEFYRMPELNCRNICGWKRMC